MANSAALVISNSAQGRLITLHITLEENQEDHNEEVVEKGENGQQHDEIVFELLHELGVYPQDELDSQVIKDDIEDLHFDDFQDVHDVVVDVQPIFINADVINNRVLSKQETNCDTKGNSVANKGDQNADNKFGVQNPVFVSLVVQMVINERSLVNRVLESNSLFVVLVFKSTGF